jgi:hypothetical protein
MKMMDPQFPPGDVDMRPPLVLAAAARTQEMKAAERGLELSTLIAVRRDSYVPVSCAVVLRDAPRQLHAPEMEMEVEGLSKVMFLLRFASLARRKEALAARSFQVGNCMLNLMPWSRRIGDSVGNLKYRTRVCLEGVPRHVRNAAAVAQLFRNPSFIDETDYPMEKKAERFCYNVWVGMSAPNDLALEGTLQLEEPVIHSDEYLFRMGDLEIPDSRAAPAETFDYNVLIHLDRVLDYSPPKSPEHTSFKSDTSGIPSVDPPTSQYPVRFDYTWHLGFRDVIVRGGRFRTDLATVVTGRTGRCRVGEMVMVGRVTGNSCRGPGMT